jgi:hypothetical protein
MGGIGSDIVVDAADIALEAMI